MTHRTIGSTSRIDGALHRTLPASFVVRAADPVGDEAIDDGLLTLEVTISSEAPYLRSSWFDDPWIEVLGHKADEVDLSRLNDGAPVLANHDRFTAVGATPLAGIGANQKAWLEGTQIKCIAKISRREALADLRQDIADGLVRNVSVGYLINERTLIKSNGEGQPDEYRVTKWLPFEWSLVDIPADAGVGLGRQADDPDPSAPRYRVVELSPAPGTTQGERSMNQAVDTPAAETTTATQTAVRGDPLQLERERAREIRALGRQFKLEAKADEAIDTGMTIENFRKLVTDSLTETGRLRPAEDPSIGLSEREAKEYSFCRALMAAADPAHAAKLAPFELECARAAQAKRDSADTRVKEREAAITIPVDVLSRGIAMNGDVAMAVAKRMIAKAARNSNEMLQYYRDLVVGTSTAGGNLVATELLGSSFIDLLRNAMVLDRLGITWLRDLNGNIAIPSQTGGATGYWVAENAAPTESQQTVGQVTFSPKTVGAFTDYSRRLLLQSSIDVEAFVRADLAATIGQTLQAASLNGSGTSNQPTGLLNMSGIGSVAGGTNGAAPTYANMVDLETAVANANAADGNLAFLTNSRVRGKLRKTEEFATTSGKPVWTSAPGQVGVGEVLGYGAHVTNSVPNTLDKGTSTGVCSAIIFGNWSDLIIAMWGGLDIMLDPYTGSTSGTKRVVALQDVDVNARRVVSFAAMKDALTT